jgi:hypothetical protein
MKRKSTLISHDYATALLEPFTRGLPSDTHTRCMCALMELVNFCGCSESIALHLALFECGTEMISEPTKPALRLSV